MSQIARPYIARCLPLTSQRRLFSSTSSRHIKTFAALRNTEQPRQPSAQVCRACGAPLNSTEAGPSSPAGILRPETWIIGAAGILTMAGLYLFIPSSPSNSGQAMQKKILDQRKVLERREGDREEEETDAERAEEAQMVKDAASEKTGKGTKK